MNTVTKSLTAVALAASFGLATIAPASADQAAATRNEIIGGVALIAGIATAINVSNKNAEANQYDYGYRNDNGYGYGNRGFDDNRVVVRNGRPGYQNDNRNGRRDDRGNGNR